MKPPTEKYKELKRLNIHIDVQLHNAFKAATATQGKEMTPVLLEFIESYVQKHLPAALPKNGRKK